MKENKSVDIETEKYIDELEQALVFMCSWYNNLNEDIFKDYIEKVNNKYEKLPTIQGFRNRMAVSNIAKIDDDIFKNKDIEASYNFSFKDIESKLKEKYNKKDLNG